MDHLDFLPTLLHGNHECHECGNVIGPHYAFDGKVRCIRCDNRRLEKRIAVLKIQTIAIFAGTLAIVCLIGFCIWFYAQQAV